VSKPDEWFIRFRPGAQRVAMGEDDEDRKEQPQKVEIILRPSGGFNRWRDSCASRSFCYLRINVRDGNGCGCLRRHIDATNVAKRPEVTVIDTRRQMDPSAAAEYPGAKAFCASALAPGSAVAAKSSHRSHRRVRSMPNPA
jgi:hypothetical protein